MADLITYMGHHWLAIKGDEITVGLTDDAASEIDEIQKILLPEQGEEFEADDTVGEIETSDGPINLYVPVNGSISEVNNAVIDDPNLIIEDPFDEGWLYKIEASDINEAQQLKSDSNLED